MLNIAVEMLNTAVDDDSNAVLVVVVVDGCRFFVLDTLLTLTTSLLIPPLLTQSLWSGTQVGITWEEASAATTGISTKAVIFESLCICVMLPTSSPL